MPPRVIYVPRGTLSSHAKVLRQRRLASTSVPALTKDNVPLWRGRMEPQTKIGLSVTGAMEWQTSMYTFNKQGIKSIPAATANLEKLIANYITAKRVDNTGKDARRIRTALALRRKAASKVYVSKPKIKDYGDWVQVRAFLWDGAAAEKEAQEARSRLRTRPGQAKDEGDQKSQKRARRQIDLLMDPEIKAPLTSLIERMYGKRVDLQLQEIKRPHLDADILAQYVAQRLKDRRFTPRRVIRDATWRVALPTAQQVEEINNAKFTRQPTRFNWSDFTMQNAAKHNATSILQSLRLSQVSSLQIEAAGRLTKRLTANRSAKKMARRGTNSKKPGYMLRGFQKAHTHYAFAGGKRRVGQFGIKVHVGHT
ncbi:hypothetical protein AC579_4779 [Pseudocercospora musae]|uniref:Small ribosomal subunit protein uS3m n=1 Tax=Pseudocercospora musae TaxID=113226 RepID=A0A139I7F0_9PEZI|nr:hypothetical protein AC579_4779 [Pseudocercospora musae]